MRTGHIIAGWEISVTMQRRTPLKWLVRHREFYEGKRRPRERLPMQHACWTIVTKSWRAFGIDEEDPPETMASEIGQIPVDGGKFLPFLIEYRMSVEYDGGTLADLAERYPQWASPAVSNATETYAALKRNLDDDRQPIFAT